MVRNGVVMVDLCVAVLYENMSGPRRSSQSVDDRSASRIAVVRKSAIVLLKVST